MRYVYLIVGDKYVFLGEAEKVDHVSHTGQAAVTGWSKYPYAGEGTIGLRYEDYENLAFITPGSSHSMLVVDKDVHERLFTS